MVNCGTNITLRDITDELLVLAFFFIPFLKFSPVASGVIVLISLISILTHFYKSKALNGVQFNPVSLLILAYMLYTIISSLFVVQEMRPFVRLVLEIRLPMLLLAIAFIFRDVVPLQSKRILRAFALGAFAAATVISIIFIISLFTAFDNISYSFLNLQLCFMGVVSLVSHRTYFCFNLITALIVFYYIYSEGWTKRKILCFLMITLLVSSVVFLSDARISLISLLMVMFFIISREMKRHLKRHIFLLLVGLVFALFVFAIYQNDRINNLLLSLFRDSVSLKDLDPRFVIWDCGLNCYNASSHPWIGVGAGGSVDLLTAEYQRIDYMHASESRWGMHNQFLEILLENGVIGLLLFVAALVSPLFIKSPFRLFYLIWIPTLCVNLFFESMMSRSIGTYPITTIWILAGIVDEKARERCYLPFRKIILLVIVGIVILITSIVYNGKDKRELFSGFQRGFERVDDLPGTLPDEIVGCHGLKIDSTTMSDTWRTWAMMYHRIDQKQMEESDSLSYSLYFYASEDFDADELSIRIEERKQNSREVYYDFDKKGTWQKLTISQRGLYGNIMFLIYCRKKDSKDFSNMKGFAIFTKPEILIQK